jgi:hypothetical protein
VWVILKCTWVHSVHPVHRPSRVSHLSLRTAPPSTCQRSVAPRFSTRARAWRAGKVSSPRGPVRIYPPQWPTRARRVAHIRSTYARAPRWDWEHTRLGLSVSFPFSYISHDFLGNLFLTIHQGRLSQKKKWQESCQLIMVGGSVGCWCRFWEIRNSIFVVSSSIESWYFEGVEGINLSGRWKASRISVLWFSYFSI